jgi:hypothetical protein
MLADWNRDNNDHSCLQAIFHVMGTRKGDLNESDDMGSDDWVKVHAVSSCDFPMRLHDLLRI